VRKPIVDKETNADTSKPSKKRPEMNAWQQYFSHKIDVSKNFDSVFYFPRFNFMSHRVEQIHRYITLHQYSAARHDHAHISAKHISVRAEWLRQRGHPASGPSETPSCQITPARRQYHAMCCISPSDRFFAVSSRSVSLPFQTNTLALWPTVTIRRNEFIGYTLASGLRCDR